MGDDSVKMFKREVSCASNTQNRKGRKATDGLNQGQSSMSWGEIWLSKGLKESRSR